MRLGPTDAAAQTLGPSIGGGLVGLVGAPLAIVIDAVSYLAEAVLNATVRVEEPRAPHRPARLGTEIGQGMRWTYRHPMLGPLTVSTHVWFVANGAALTALSLLALRELGFSALTYGLLLTVFGVSSLIGASSAAVLTGRIGAGRAIVGARSLYPLAWILVAVAPPSELGAALLFVAIGVQGAAMGIENTPEQLLWQTLTPDRFLGRTNTTDARATGRSPLSGRCRPASPSALSGIGALWPRPSWCSPSPRRSRGSLRCAAAGKKLWRSIDVSASARSVETSARPVSRRATGSRPTPASCTTRSGSDLVVGIGAQRWRRVASSFCSLPRMGESVETTRPREARYVSTIVPIDSASVMPQLSQASA